jgi:hypothetical protein
MNKRFRFSGLAVTAACVILVGDVGCSSGDSATDLPDSVQLQTLVQLKTLSNRADLINGGDALVEAILHSGLSFRQLSILVDGRNVTSAFAVRADGRIVGVISGLAEGPNKVVARLNGRPAAALVITNHKIGGPVTTGPQIMPFVCATPLARPAQGNQPATNTSGLSTEAFDVQCNIATEVKLFYRTSNPSCANVVPDPNPPAVPNPNACFKPYNPLSPPADLAMTTTDTGVTVPYIVRVERGTLNRGIYDIAVLFDPTADNVALGWKPFAPQPGWNRKLVYSFGASSGQPRRQFRSEQSWADHNALSRGFLVAINSMTDSLYNSNRTAMTETLMMMKEKVIDTYGEVRYTIGNGCSGGSINQLTAASIYPGLLDGIQPTCTYPDSETTAVEVADCSALVNAYNSPAWKTLMAAEGLAQPAINTKKAAINGHVDQNGCHAWVNSFSNLGRPGNYIPIVVLDNNTGVTGPSPAVTTPINNCQLPNSMIYDPVTNPGGLRCTGADHAVSIFGTAPGTNRARSTTDNVGVQYGLKALISGAITAEDFVTLNEVVGGIDGDNNFIPTRTVGDPVALATVYRAGIVSDGQHLARTPIIDLRGYDDSAIHHIWRSFALRARLDQANGNHNNHVMWRYGTGLIAPPASGLTLQSFVMMDQWIAALKADTSTAPLEDKVAASRPAAAFDFCYLTSDTTFSTKVTDFAVCDTDRFLKPHASPRQIAGGPVAENILKCQLKPLDPADYAPVVLTAEQLARLSAAFPTGVCDFSKPGVGQQPAVSPLDFSAGPGGVPLPAAPTTTAP